LSKWGEEGRVVEGTLSQLPPRWEGEEKGEKKKKGG